MDKRYFIEPTAGKLRSALAFWRWLDLDERKPILVTAFADVFLRSSDAIWFLNAVTGALEPVCRRRRELDKLLSTPEGRRRYLMADLVDMAQREGQRLEAGQSYDFKLHPVLGGALAYANVERRHFVVALHLRGQLHAQARCGADSGGPAPVWKEAPSKRFWWKLW